MKLPVKLLTAVAALALLVVGVVSVQNAGNSAQADVTGSVNLTNKWSTLTTNSSPPSGRVFVGSGKTLYASMENKTSTGTPQNVIIDKSDELIITVSDSDVDDTTPATHAFTLTSVAADADETFNIPAAKTPIIGDMTVWWDVDGDGNYEPTTDDSTGDRTGEFGIGVLNVGNGTTQNGVVTLVNDATGISGATGGDTFFFVYETSAVDSLTVQVTTTVQTTPITVRLNETGRATGVFEGIVQLVDNEFASVASSATSAFGGVASDCSAATPATCNIGKALVSDASVITAKYADALGAGGSAVNVQQTARIELSAPTPIVSAPASGSSVQVRKPSFSGTVSDTGAGLDVSSIILYHDNTDDAGNATAVLTPSAAPSTNVGAITAISTPGAGTIANTPTFTGSPVDGTTSVSWSFTPTADIPTVTTPPPDHVVDFQLVAFDLAGNVGFSDSNTSTASPGTGAGNSEVHTVKIDQSIPVLTGGSTGKYWDSVNATLKSNNRRSIQLFFNDSVAGVDNTDFEVKLDSGTILIPTTAQVVASMPTSVFLTIGTDLPSSDTPLVSVVGQISDAAGNTTSAGNTETDDFLAPVVTVTLSGGSGTGTGSTGPSGLTKQTMIIDIVSDENLATTPTVQIFNAGSTTVPEATGTAIAQGANVWRATLNASGYDDVTNPKKSVVVTAKDASAQANERKTGNVDVTGSGAQTFVVDHTAPTLVNAGGTVSTSQRKPFVVIDYTGDAHTVTINVATVGGADVLSSLATTDNKKFFYVPAADLALGDTTVEAKATDLAGNEGIVQSYTLTVTERKAFDLQLFAGWNAKSFPSDPLDPAIGSVFTNTGIDQVVRYNATDTASPWRIATRDAVSGAWTSSTATPLNTILAGRGYWVHTNNFAPQSVQLVGPVTPAGGSPPPVATIPTGAGWNFVGVVSQSRAQTEGASGASLTRTTSTGGTSTVTVADYFATVNQGRVYRYDSATLSFRELTAGDVVNVGEALWVFVSRQSDGSLPAIVP